LHAAFDGWDTPRICGCIAARRRLSLSTSASASVSASASSSGSAVADAAESAEGATAAPMEWLQPDGNPWPRVPVERDDLEACYSLETQLSCGRFSSVWEAQAIRKPGEAPTARVSVKVMNVVEAGPASMSGTSTGE
jgi:hypothetical protein